jgi:hypothetical protein
MIRRHPVLTALALASAAIALGQPAQAGGGVRLSFGGPLGTFVATPTPGYGGGSGYATAKPKTYAAKRAPVETAERRRSKPARQVVQVRHRAPAYAAKAIPLTTNENAAPGLLGRTLALDNLPRPEMVRVLSPTETVVARDGEDAQTAAAPIAKASAKIAVAQGPATCRKFIPAVGVTVTVACD